MAEEWAACVCSTKRALLYSHSYAMNPVTVL